VSVHAMVTADGLRQDAVRAMVTADGTHTPWLRRDVHAWRPYVQWLTADGLRRDAVRAMVTAEHALSLLYTVHLKVFCCCTLKLLIS